MPAGPVDTIAKFSEVVDDYRTRVQTPRGIVYGKKLFDTCKLTVGLILSYYLMVSRQDSRPETWKCSSAAAGGGEDERANEAIVIHKTGEELVNRIGCTAGHRNEEGPYRTHALNSQNNDHTRYVMNTYYGLLPPLSHNVGTNFNFWAGGTARDGSKLVLVKMRWNGNKLVADETASANHTCPAVNMGGNYVAHLHKFLVQVLVSGMGSFQMYYSLVDTVATDLGVETTIGFYNPDFPFETHVTHQLIIAKMVTIVFELMDSLVKFSVSDDDLPSASHIAHTVSEAALVASALGQVTIAALNNLREKKPSRKMKPTTPYSKGAMGRSASNRNAKLTNYNALLGFSSQCVPVQHYQASDIARIICDTLGLHGTSGKPCPVTQGASPLLAVMLRVRDRNLSAISDIGQYFFEPAIELSREFDDQAFYLQVTSCSTALASQLSNNKSKIVDMAATAAAAAAAAAAGAAAAAAAGAAAAGAAPAGAAVNPLVRLDSAALENYMRQFHPDVVAKLHRASAKVKDEQAQTSKTPKRNKKGQTPRGSSSRNLNHRNLHHRMKTKKKENHNQRREDANKMRTEAAAAPAPAALPYAWSNDGGDWSNDGGEYNLDPAAIRRIGETMTLDDGGEYNLHPDAMPLDE